MNPRRRLHRRVGIVALLSMTLVLAAAVPASASTLTLLTDGFEAQSASWQLYHSGTGSAEYAQDTEGFARTGTGYILLAAKTGFSSLGRTFTAPLLTTSCTASVYIDPVSFPSGHAKLNLEMINPSDFSYLALSTVDYTTDSWHSASITVSSPGTFLFRVSLLSSQSNQYTLADLDDFSLRCKTLF